MAKKRILYFIHVPWQWIKQRPHFIAEGLSEKYDVTVCETIPLSAQFQMGKSDVVRIKSYLQLPKDRIPLVHLINTWLLRLSLRKELRNADAIWITNPFQYSFLKKGKARIIFDCMDDLPEFEPTPERREKLERIEGKLYRDADVVVASSKYLKNKLAQRYGEREVAVVNNAIKQMDDYNLQELPAEIRQKMPVGKFTITYIGTIEKWIDFSLINEVLEQCPEVAFCFFGPLKVELPKSDRVCYCGMVPHDLVFSVMENSDALIMPFELSELILSVNPVKLYEYIYSGKPCLAPHYGESEAFGEYAYLYESNLDCCEIIKSLIAGKGAKHTKEESKAFAMSNTWKERVEQIENLIG